MSYELPQAIRRHWQPRLLYLAASIAVCVAWAAGSPADAMAGDSHPLPAPVANVTPVSVDITVAAGSTGSDTMVISNTGGSNLMYSISANETFNPNPPSYKTAAAAQQLAGRAGQTFGLTSSRALGSPLTSGLPVILDETMISQMADNSPGDEGVSCVVAGMSTVDNSWWRRFDFGEHPRVGASANITAVTVSSASNAVPGGLPVTINLYTIAHSAVMDTIPTEALTLIGTASGLINDPLASVTIPVKGRVADTVGKDLVVEYHTEGSELGQFFPGSNATAGTHPTFLSSTACGIGQPTTAAVTGFPNFHLNMVVSVSADIPSMVGCNNPHDIPWLSTSSSSGTLAAGESRNVVARVNATALAAGDYSANLCMTTNDPLQPLITMPFRFAVVAGDAIFCSGFEDGGEGSCATLGDIVYSGPRSVAIPPTAEGLNINYVTGEMSSTDVPGFDFRVYRGDPYLLGPVMVFSWGGGATAENNAGVGLTDIGPYLVLDSGDTIGPASNFVHYSGSLSQIMVHYWGGMNGYLGVKFMNEETGKVNYGYVHMMTTAFSGFPATILDYAYDKTGAAIKIP